jgi:hypothetical protein
MVFTSSSLRPPAPTTTSMSAVTEVSASETPVCARASPATPMMTALCRTPCLCNFIDADTSNNSVYPGTVNNSNFCFVM